MRVRPWLPIVVATVLVAGIPAHAVVVPAAGAADSPQSGGQPPCNSRASTDPALWEVALPTANLGSLKVSDPACVHEVGRDGSAVVWRNADGTFTKRAYASPVNFKAADGKWRAIDTRLSMDTSGSFVNKAGPFAARFAADSSARDLVSVSSGKTSLSMGFTGIAGPNGSVRASDAAQATVGGDGSDTVTYAGAAPGIDLRYQVLSEAVKEVLVLNAPLRAGQSPDFSFNVQLDGLKAQTADDGTIEFVDSADGSVKFSIPQGMASDSSGNANPDTGTPAATTPVAVRLVSSADPLVATLDVSIDPTWLSDPARVFPVFVDPTMGAGSGGLVSGDAYVADTATTTTYNGSSQYDSGSGQYWDKVGKASGTNYRSFLQFPSLGDMTGDQILSAHWNGYVYSDAGTPVTVTLKPVNATWSPSAVTWTNQPAVRTNSATVNVSTTGAFVSVDIASWVTNWTKATGAWTNDGIRLSGPTTGSVNFAAQEAPSAQQPYIDVNYDAYPTIDNFSAGGQYFPGTVNTSTPTLSTRITDTDTTTGLIAHFEVWNSTHTGSALYAGPVTGHYPPSVTSGQRYGWAVADSSGNPVSLADGTYTWRVKGDDGQLQTVWSAWQTLTVDTTPPNTTAITMTGVTPNTWGSTLNSAHLAGNGSTDVFGFVWGDNVGSNPTTFAKATSNAANVNTSGGAGWHDIAARSVDKAGNTSATVTHFAFGYGAVGLSAPGNDFQTQRRVTVTALSWNSGTNGLTLQWRPSESATWADIPTGDVTYKSSGSGIGSWPVTGTVGSYSTTFPDLVWDAANTASLVDGPMQLRAKVTYSGAGLYSATENVMVNQNGFGSGFAAAPVGPGNANLLTGNLELQASDVSLGGGSVTRTFDSRNQSATGSVFGPGWVSNIATGTSMFRSLVDNTDNVVIAAVDGTETTFRQQPGGSYTAQDGSSDLTLTKVSSSRFELNVFGFETFGFTNYDSGATPNFKPSDVTDATGQTSTIDWTLDTASGLTRPTQIVAPPPPGVTTCLTSPLTTRGCETLTFDYASSTASTSTCGGTYGDVAGQLRKVSYTAWDPDLGTPAMHTVDVASYCYDTTTDRLMTEWDPRLSSPLKVQYSYDSNGHIATLTPPGLNAWSFTYTHIGLEPTSTGRISTVFRTMPTASGNQTATTTFAYQIPLSISGGGPADMQGSNVAAWAQHDVPTDATSVFPPDQTPSGTPPSSYARATTFYMNGEGMLVNVANPAGGITTTEHDAVGNVIRTLTATNRAQALATGSTATDHATEAELIDSEVVYDITGYRVSDSYGPAHVVDLPDGTQRRSRAHIHYVYDQGSPGGAEFDLVTTQTESAAPVDLSAEQDTRTTTYAYTIGADTSGWTLGTRLQTTIDPSGLDLITTTKYDVNTGRLTARTLPANPSGGGAHETDFIYYTAGTNTQDTACGGKPEWVDLPCKTLLNTQPGGSLPDIAIKHATRYDMYGQPKEAMDETTGGTALRTTTIGYDAADRPVTQAVSSSVGTSLPTTTSAYNTLTGLPTTTTDGTYTITRGYDAVGQLSSYQDADGNTSTYSYDKLGRPDSTYDGKATTTYAYDTSGGSGSDMRGLPTSITDSQAGTWTASYDADGRLQLQGTPNPNFVAIHIYDETGEPTVLSYYASGTWPYFVATYNIHGQRTTDTGITESFAYQYDNAGRLTTTNDSLIPLPGGQSALCTTRNYTFDADSNRTNLNTVVGGVLNLNAPCPPTGSGTNTTPTPTYDAADRITNTGYTYDTLGRTTALPASGSPSGYSTTLSYYTNDRVNTVTANGTTLTNYLDPNRRVRQWTDATNTHTNHYAGDSDSPTWIAENTSGAWTRNVAPYGGLSATVDNSGNVTLQLANLHGDIFSTITTTETDWQTNLYNGGTGAPTWTATDEYGNPETSGQPVGTRYDYLGTAQRQRDTNSGLQLMGQRVYNPTTGRFLQTDPVPGGSANKYDYVGGDPVNASDLEGACTTTPVARPGPIPGCPPGFPPVGPTCNGNAQFSGSYAGGNLNYCAGASGVTLYISVKYTLFLWNLFWGLFYFFHDPNPIHDEFGLVCDNGPQLSSHFGSSGRCLTSLLRIRGDYIANVYAAASSGTCLTIHLDTTALPYAINGQYYDAFNGHATWGHSGDGLGRPGGRNCVVGNTPKL